jgi:protein-disulfide isomerase
MDTSDLHRRISPRRALAALVLLWSLLPVGLAAQGSSKDVLAERSKGSATAPITVYEMSDFQCPYCRQHAVETFPGLEKRYIDTGKVRWVFLNFPLTSIHPNAAAAAELALCGARVGKFWAFHDLLFKYQETWAPLKEPGPFLASLIDSAHAPRQLMEACLTAGAARPELEADAQAAQRSGAQSTPTFYIEGGLLVGSQPAALWQGILDSIYASKKSVNGKR